MTNHAPTALELLTHHAPYDDAIATIQRERKRWLITGGAGFIGSHLAETLLALDQEVVVLDDLSSGSRANLAHVRGTTRNGARHLAFVHGDVRHESLVHALVRRVDLVLHQAARVGSCNTGDAPIRNHDVNVTGFLTILEAARRNGTRILYAASCADDGLNADASTRGSGKERPRSMYAATKRAGEAYAAAYHATYDLPTIGLRYVQIHGARQDPSGPHAAMIPIWIDAMRRGEPCTIHGDGSTSHDVCHVANIVGATLLAALTDHDDAIGDVLDVGTGHATNLLALHDAIGDALRAHQAGLLRRDPIHAPVHSDQEAYAPTMHADVTRTRDVLGFEPVVDLLRGVDATVAAALATPLPPAIHSPHTRLAISQERVTS